MKLQHNYKIENKITLNSFFTLPSSHKSSNGDLHKPNENQGREWLHLGGVEWGARVWDGKGVLGEDGGKGAAA
jgi:hypothetical protein